MLHELKTRWNDVMENDDHSVSNLSSKYMEMVDEIKNKVIPSFFEKENATIKELYDNAEQSDRSYLTRSMSFPQEKYNEYATGMNAYVKKTIDKCCNEPPEAIKEELGNVKTKSNEFVSGLFSDVFNPTLELPMCDALSCVESVMDIYNRCDQFKENCSMMSDVMESCGNEDCKTQLSELFFATEGSYLLNYLESCMAMYDGIKNAYLNPVVEESVQVF